MSLRNNKKPISSEFFLAVFVIAVFLLLCVFAKDFASMNNLMSILNRFSYILIAAIGMNLIIITGNIDVSFGAIISVMCILIAAIGKLNAPIIVFMPLAMLCGGILCAINALLITKMRIPAIVATLATTQLFAGVLPLLVEGSIYDLPASFTWLAFEAKLFGIPLSAFIMAIIFTIAIIFMKNTRFAKKIYAIGNNPQGARLAGINVDMTILIAYIIAGMLLGISATIIGTSGQRVTTTMGAGMEMTFIAAVVVGGTSVSGGSGTIIGTAFGALLLSLISPALFYLGFSDSWSTAVMGMIIIIAVLVSALRSVKHSVGGAG